VAKCRFCGSPDVPAATQRCPACGEYAWTLLSTEKREVAFLSEEEDQVVERVDVGCFNDIFGGGIAETSVNLIAGPPGAGKTTLFLMLCLVILSQYADGIALYIANEQSRKELRGYALRLGMQPVLGRIAIVDCMGGLQRPLDSIVEEYHKKYRVRLGILDSLTKLVGDDANLGVMFVETFKYLTVKWKFPSLIVNQVTKGGEHAGLNKLLHAGDGLLNLEKDDVTGLRLLRSTKNRFGPAPVELPMAMLPEDADRPGWLVPLDEEEFAERQGASRGMR
jgi:DNA repair protein RadA/Sms